MQLRVIQDSNNLGIGKIDAQVGMKLANGYKIVKVNDKSMIARSAVPEAIAERDNHTEKFFHPTSIYYTVATAWGFTCSKVNDQTEQLAAIKKKFTHGERKFKLYHENGYVLSLCEARYRARLRYRIEQAGYDFAKEVQVQKDSEIAKLLEVKEALGSTSAI